MGEPGLSWCFESEDALVAAAAECARRWAAAARVTRIVGLRGELGAGKTTWVRGMLRGLGFSGRVPSPTYTLVEPYEVNGLAIIHVDLYRLNSAGELEGLGLRDYLRDPNAWLLVEWPERHAALAARADLMLDFALADPGRRVELAARSEVGHRMLTALPGELSSSNHL